MLVLHYKKQIMNWGKGITLAIIAFISYILFMVFTMISTSSDLVEDNYYEKGINFESRIQAIKNSKAIKERILIRVEKEFLAIEFPEDVIMKDVTEGTIHLYRPENGKLDRRFSFSKAAGNMQLVELNKIEKGSYKLLLSWKTNESDYYVEKGHLEI